MSNTKRLTVRSGLDNNNKTIINVTDPVNSQDAATKLYTDNLVAAETARAMAAETSMNAVSTVTTVTANYTVNSTDDVIMVNAGGAINITLLAAATAGIGRIYIIKRLSTPGASRTVTITPASTQTIDGASTKTLTTQYSSITVISNGSNWFII